jgi:putative heme-binding domain-containing protein
MRCLVVLLLFPAALAIADDAKDGDTLPALVELLSSSDDAQFQLDILKGMSEALKGRAGVKMPTGWQEASAKLAKSSSAEVRALAQSLSTLFGDVASIESARKIVLDKLALPELRNKALLSLLESKPKDFAPFLQGLLADPAVRQQTLTALAAYDDPKTPKLILAEYKSLTPAEKLDALNTLSSREPYALVLLAALREKTVPRADLSASIVRQLASIKNDEIEKWIKDNWGSVRGSSEEKLKDMAGLKATILSAKPGEADLSRGRAIFAKTCLQCHTLFGEGGKVGPDLTGSGRADVDYLMSNLVDPSAVVGKDYLVWLIRTKDKRLISGIISREDDNAVTVVSENETIILPRPQILRMKESDTSMMPEGLLQGLPRQELLDLISYLRSPVQVPLPSVLKQ